MAQSGEMTFDEQIAKLNRLGIKDEAIKFSADKKKINIAISGDYLNLDFQGLTLLTGLVLQLDSFNNISFESLRKAINLRSLFLSADDGSDINKDDIYQLFIDHPNREQLTVSTTLGDKFVWADVIKKMVSNASELKRENPDVLAGMGSDGYSYIEMFIGINNRDSGSTILRKVIVDLKKLHLTSFVKSLNLNGSLIDQNDLLLLKNFKNLESLKYRFRGMSDADLEILLSLTNLKKIELDEASVSEDSLYKFWVRHPNRENMVVILNEGSSLKWEDVPESYKKDQAVLEKSAQVQKTLTTTDELLKELVNSLIDKPQVLSDLGRRFAADGLEDAFLKLLHKLNLSLPAVSSSAVSGQSMRSQPAVSSSGITAKNKNLGGIDMNSNALDLQTSGEEIKFDMPFDPTQLQNIQIDGFAPVILQIVPTNLPLFIGVKQTEKELQLSQLK